MSTKKKWEKHKSQETVVFVTLEKIASCTLLCSVWIVQGKIAVQVKALVCKVSTCQYGSVFVGDGQEEVDGHFWFDC